MGMNFTTMFKHGPATKNLKSRAIRRKAHAFVKKHINTSSSAVYYLRSPFLMDMVSAIHALVQDMGNNPVDGVDYDHIKELWEKVNLIIMQQLWARAGNEPHFSYMHRVDRFSHLILCSFAFLSLRYLDSTPKEAVTKEVFDIPTMVNWLTAFLHKYGVDFKERGIFGLESVVEIYDELFKYKTADIQSPELLSE